MAEQFKYLFTPLKIGPVTVPNRIAISGHGTLFGDPNPSYGGASLYGERYARYLADRAKGGVGLITYGQGAVHPSCEVELPNMSVSYDERAVPGFKMATEMIHEQGAKTFIQINHSGLHNGLGSRMVGWSASEVAPIPGTIQGSDVAKEMEKEDIEELKDYYARAARNAKAGGFDGIEVHATHNYLLPQFLSPLFNKRTDEYGGSLENRMRLLVEVIGRVRDTIGNEMALGVRISGDEFFPGALTQDDMKEIARRLEATGKIDFLNVSLGIYNSGKVIVAPMYFPHGAFTYLAAGIKGATKGVRVFTVGRIVDPVEAENILANGHADMVMMTRANIADPEIANKAKQGRLDEIRNCLGCLQLCASRINVGLPISCTQNPAVGQEKVWGIGTMTPAAKKKKVMVIGGGPGGMEAAWVAAARGHQVTLYDKGKELGGQNLLAAKLPGRQEMDGITRWRKTMLDKQRVKVVLNTEVTTELVLKEKPDAVVVATGSTPKKDGFNPYTYAEVPGWNQEGVVTADDVVSGKAKVGQSVVVCDMEARIRAIGVAEMLAGQGKQVQFVTPGPVVGAGHEGLTAFVAWERAAQKGVNVLTGHVVLGIDLPKRTVQLIETPAMKPRTLTGVDTVVMVGHNKSDSRLYKELKGKVAELHRVGDALAPRSSDCAIYEGHEVGRKL